MAVTMSFVSQKGGVGKSTLARSVAVEAAKAGVDVVIADLDIQQGTIQEWAKLRYANGIEPTIRVKPCRTADDALLIGSTVDLLLIDGPARASAGTLVLAQQSDLIVQPTGVSLDDLRPAVVLFHELVNHGIPADRLVMALVRTGSEAQEVAARTYIEKAGYSVLDGAIADKPAYCDSLNRGEGLTETRHRQLAEKAAEVVAALLVRLKKKVEQRRKLETGKTKKRVAT